MDKKDIVNYVAGLARININKEEAVSLGEQLSRILDYIDKLKESDTAGIEPLRGLHVERNIFREDKVEPCDAKERILKNSPQELEGYFKIPKVID